MGYTPQVLVVGGGVLGTAIARDFAIRGLEVTLVERGRLAGGATGRSLGVVGAGARVEDEQLARRASRERQILGTIAGHCLDPTGGLLVEEGSGTGQLESRLEARGISCGTRDGVGADLSPEFDAISVPDAVVDPVKLAVENARGAVEFGATISPGTAVTAIETDGGTVGTVTVERDPAVGPGVAVPTDRLESDGGTTARRVGPSTETLDPDYVVNAAGAWAGEVAGLAGLEFEPSLRTGTVVVLEERPVETVVTRLTDTGESTIVPVAEKAVVGTATERAGEPSRPVVSRERTEAMLERVGSAVPAIENARQRRWDWGTYARDPNAAGRREHTILDHGDRDGCWGMTTVVGGSLTTHRLAAEQVVDQVCAEFGITRGCQTDEIPLPGGRRAETPAGQTPKGPMLCECRSVARGAVRSAIEDETAVKRDLAEVRARTGAMAGECQGGNCAHRIATELFPAHDESVVGDSLDSFLDDYWQGRRYALSGAGLRRAMQSYVLRVESLALPASDEQFVASHPADGESSAAENAVSLAAFDDGTDSARRDRPTWGERPP